MNLTITLLNKQHNRKAFDCGTASLNQYLYRYANQDIKRRVSRVFIASPSTAPEQVVGYYSLSAGSLDVKDMPETQRRRLPKYPIPIAMLGRLAISKDYQRQGLGATLLVDALQRVAQASQVIAVYALVVDALNEQASDFYHKFGFTPFPEQPLKLFLPMDSIVTLLD